MRRFILSLALLAATPAYAYERADASECQAIWQAFADALPASWKIVDQPERIQAQTTDDGWCRLVGETPGLENAGFETLDYRVDGINRIILDKIPPKALGLRLRNVTTGGAQAQTLQSVRIDLSHDQPSQSLLVEHFEFMTEHGGRLQLTAVFNHLDLNSRGTMMMSLGGISLSQAAGVLEVKGADDLLDARDGSDSDKAMLLRALDMLPDDKIGANSTAALAAFLDRTALDGTLRFSLRSERGIGMLQAIMGGWSSDIETDTDLAEALEILLDGVTVSFDWTPDRTTLQ